MASVADMADEFVRRARNGEDPSVFVPQKYLALFLEMLKRDGIAFARACIDQITDQTMREIVEVVFFPTLAGAALGAAIGGSVGGPHGAAVGAALGGGLGLAAGALALTIHARQRDGGLQISMATST